MIEAGASDNASSGQAVDAVVCPLCRYTVAGAPKSRLSSCPHHPDRVMIPSRALSEADGDPFLGMVVGGRFAVLELLGAGSMGTVYRARQEAVSRDVALKIVRSDRLIDPQAKGRFEQEARATSLLTSPHTVTVFDFGEVQLPGEDPHFVSGSLYLAMELLDGVSLGSRLKREGKVPPAEAVRIVRHALSSLSEAHAKGVIHRDLKPDNLLLTHSPSGEPICKVLDFGIAKLVTQEGGIDALETQAGTVFGTPRYMSPEQAQGKKLDARSDLYSLGVILYHMLLGRAPYTDGDAVVVMAHHIKTVPKRPNLADPDLGLASDLEDLLMRVLSKDPALRPQSADEFVAALDALGPLETTTASAELTAVVGEPAARSGGARARVMLAGSAIAALVGLAAAMAVTTEPPAAGSRGASRGLALAAAALGRWAVAAHLSAPRPNELSPEAGGSQGGGSASPPPIPPPARPQPKRGYQKFDH